MYAHLTAAGETIKAAATAALAAAGVGHLVQATGTMFSVFLTDPADGPVRDFAGASRTDTTAYAAFFHAMLDRGVYLPAVGVRGVVPVLRPRRPRRPDGARRPAARRPRRPPPPTPRENDDAPDTIVHLLRHGEVHNPDGMLYGRSDGFHLSVLGQQMAQKVADAIGERDIMHLRISPLERAQETAQPLATARGLGAVVDPRVIESTNVFEGERFTGPGSLRRPATWRHLWNPFRPSWGEPYKDVTIRMMSAVRDAREEARGHEAVIVSHQLPIWITRLARREALVPARPAQAPVHAVLAHVAALQG